MDPRPGTDEYQTKTPLALPFSGEWLVGNGGRDHEKNGHRAADGTGPESQMFAYDFVRPHAGDGRNLEDYEAFGAEVVAPGDGVVSRVVDGSEDVPIGENDWVVLCGNMVVIDHGNGEWSVLAHLRHGSIGVKVGDAVARGQLLGLCGNTGNTSEPHVHYHLQDGPDMHRARGLPLQFKEVVIDGRLAKDMELEQGQKVANPPAEDGMMRP